MRRFGLCVGYLLTFASFAEAEEWRILKGAQISEVLIGATLEFESAWQDFRASGKTLYNAGENSWGNWRVENDQYCSRWPPSDLWDCYDVAISDDQIRFTGAYDDVSVGVIRK